VYRTNILFTGLNNSDTIPADLSACAGCFFPLPSAAYANTFQEKDKSPTEVIFLCVSCLLRGT